MNSASRFIVSFLFTAACYSSLSAQLLDSNVVNRLYHTAKVWGYMKYFHSEVAKGAYNWDSVLIQTLPDVINASSETQYNTAILSMIKKPGMTARTFIPPPVIPESLKFNLDLAWINDPIFSSEVKDSLNAIKTWARNRNNYYVQQEPSFANSNPIFPNDKQFYDTVFPLSQEIRLLSLFRYWNIINYFYPYKNILDRIWDDLLMENIPKFFSATTEASYLRAVLALQHNLNDSHAFTNAAGSVIDTLYPNLPVSWGGYYLPVFLNYVEGKTVVMKVLIPGSGIQSGDIVTKINGVDILTIRDGLRSYTAGSNATVIDRNINYRLTRGKQNENVQWDIESSDGAHSVTLTRTLEYATWRSQVFQSTPSWQKITRGGTTLGIVNMEKLVESEIDSMFKDLAATDGIIFDLRNYPQWTNWKFAKHLYPSSFVFSKYTYPDVRYAGTFGWRNEVIGGTPLFTPYSGKVVILFNEETQSLSEATVMAIEQYKSKDSIKAHKIGSQTSGADGNVSNVYLPGKLQVWFTGLGWYYPDYTPTQRIGIKPDMEVKPTIAGIRQGKDEVLDAAIDYIIGPNSVAEENNIPRRFSLFQNYPNPFNPTTIIRFQIPLNPSFQRGNATKSQGGFVTLKIFDLLGREVETLVNEQKQPGVYEVTWNARDVSSGVYFYQLRSGDFVQTKKLVLQK
ncbi:MAG: T9SS type A sorting domain-containing protein [Bacteroidota bacterium]